MDVAIVGIDCATDPKKTGMALGFAEEDRPEVLAASTGKHESPAAIVYDWIRDRRRVLLALDAPLGWPGRPWVRSWAYIEQVITLPDPLTSSFVGKLTDSSSD